MYYIRLTATSPSIQCSLMEDDYLLNLIPVDFVIALRVDVWASMSHGEEVLRWNDVQKPYEKFPTPAALTSTWNLYHFDLF